MNPTARCARLIFVLVAGAVCVPVAQGTTGLAFLKTGVDAGATLIGEAVTSHVSDASACYWNPAGLAHIDSPTLLVSHVESFADIRHEYAAAVQPLGRLNAGIFFNGLWTDDLEGYDEQANPTGAFGFSTYATGLSLGLPIRDGLNAGGTLKYLNESIGAYSATGWVVDLGAQWIPSDDVPLQFGGVVQNLGPSLTYIEESFDAPLMIQGGASYAILLDALQGRVELAAEARHVRDEGGAFLAGAAYEYRELLRFGLGYQGGRDTRDVSVGLGVHPGRLSAYWAYVPFSDDLGEEHRFSLGLDL